jgi:hypothetical protein
MTEPLKQSDRDLEAETIIRWDRTGEPAILWTADPAEARRWRKLGYPVEVFGRTRDGRERSWTCRAPIEAVALLAMKAGAVKIPRYLEPPIVRVAQDARQSPGREIVSEIAEQNRAEISPAGESRAA